MVSSASRWRRTSANRLIWRADIAACLGSASSRTGSKTTVYKGCGYYPNSLSGTTVTCTTDKDGDIKSKSTGGSFSYDAEDRLTSAKVGKTTTTSYFDGLGNRVERQDAQDTFFTYQGVNLLWEKNVRSGATVDHIYGDGMQMAKVAGGTTYYYHEDQTGSNRLVTYVRSGKVTTQFSWNYEPHGTSYGASGSETIQYADRMLDSGDALYYFNARFYDPSIMRFMTKDPISADPSGPVAFSSNAYAGDSPLTNTDQTGLVTTLGIRSATPEQMLTYIRNYLRQLFGIQCDQQCVARDQFRDKLLFLTLGLVGGGKGDVAYLDENGNFPFQTAPPDPTWKAGALSKGGQAAYRQLSWNLGGTYKDIEGIGGELSVELNLWVIPAPRCTADDTPLAHVRCRQHRQADNPIQDQKDSIEGERGNPIEQWLQAKIGESHRGDYFQGDGRNFDRTALFHTR